MGRYQVNHPYTAVLDGRRLGPWVAGDDVDLDAADADFVNRDSPGCVTDAATAHVVDVEPPPTAPKPARQAKAGRDRMHRGGRDRGAT